MFCADLCPWDPAVLCDLPDGHYGFHEALDVHTWGDGDHHEGDRCPAGAHDELAVGS